VIDVPDYTAALTGDLKGLKIAVLKEGFETPDSMESVNTVVRGAIETLARLGAEVAEVSVPMHRLTGPLWNCIAIEGGLASFGTGHTAYQTKSYYNPRLMSAMVRALKTHAHDLSPTAKLGMVVADYMRDRFDGVFYARAQNQARALTAAYDAVFETADLVVMPTTPQTAHKTIPLPEEDRTAHIVQALNMVWNTAAFDMTGHPSISVPVHGVDGMPVGLMLTGRSFEDATVLRAAHAYEQAG
jgi:amidase